MPYFMVTLSVCFLASSFDGLLIQLCMVSCIWKTWPATDPIMFQIWGLPARHPILFWLVSTFINISSVYIPFEAFPICAVQTISSGKFFVISFPQAGSQQQPWWDSILQDYSQPRECCQCSCYDPTITYFLIHFSPEPVLLDVTSIAANRILLDSYFTVVIFHGASIAQWWNAGYLNQPEHEEIHGYSCSRFSFITFLYPLGSSMKNILFNLLLYSLIVI